MSRLGSFSQDEIDRLYEYFGRFGGIRAQNVTVEGGQTSIEYRFWDARVYSDVIHHVHSLFGSEVEVSWFKKVKSGPVQHVVQDDKMRRGRCWKRFWVAVGHWLAPLIATWRYVK